jgi:hypothetical protein
MDGPDAGSLPGPSDQVHGIAKIASIVVAVKGRSRIRLTPQESNGTATDQLFHGVANVMSQEPVAFQQSVSKRVKWGLRFSFYPTASGTERFHRFFPNHSQGNSHRKQVRTNNHESTAFS